jgi:hypothetical protein
VSTRARLVAADQFSPQINTDTQKLKAKPYRGLTRIAADQKPDKFPVRWSRAARNVNLA